MSPSKILFYLCISFVVGISLESFIKISQAFLWVFLFTAIFLIIFSIFFKKDNFIIIGFCIFLFALGILRVQVSEFNIANDKLSKFNGKGQIVLTGIVFDEPDIRDTSQKIKIKVADSIILVTTKRYPEYKYLDKIKLTGKLQAPPKFDDFNYQDYLLKDGIYSVMNYPKIDLVSQKHQYNILTFLYEKVLFFKEKLSESINKNFSPPHSLILEGIILGNNKNMTQDLRTKLSVTGLRYLTAISGVHVIILSGILFSFLMMFGFLRRQQALLLSIFLIWLYVALTGFTASGIRAAIMGNLFLLAQVFGRQNTTARTITLAAALMLFQNPLLLFYDVGFQLSFLASMGIIYIKPPLVSILKFSEKYIQKNLLDMICVTLSAQLATLPIMVFNFGNIPLVGPITSILVLPIVPLILIFGFLSSILGIVSNVLGFIFFIPSWILLSYFLKVMDVFSAPWMSKTIENVSWIWLAVYYFIICLFVWLLNKKYSQKFV